MIKSIKTFVANESGATAIEYALIASLIAVAIIASISVLGSKLQNTFNEVSGKVRPSRTTDRRGRPAIGLHWS